MNKYRSFKTSSNLTVTAGKNATQNDSIIKTAKKNDLILHTSEPGSPFCIIKAIKGEIDKSSISEAGIFCAAFSQGWKKKKKVIDVQLFAPNSVYKDKKMSTGTFGVRKIIKKFKVKPILAIGKKNKKIQCSPIISLDEAYLTLIQGNMDKTKTAEKIVTLLKGKNIKITKEKLMMIIPSGGFNIK